jgi:hypothetical protein
MYLALPGLLRPRDAGRHWRSRHDDVDRHRRIGVRTLPCHCARNLERSERPGRMRCRCFNTSWLSRVQGFLHMLVTT